MKRQLQIGLLAVLCAACGVDGDNKEETWVVTTDTLASTYTGRLFMEAFDEDMNVENRLDLDEYVIDVSRDPNGGMLIDGLAICAIRVADDLTTIPPQSCAEQQVGERLVVEIAGTIQANAKRLKIDLDQTWTSYDDLEFPVATYLTVTTFEGVASSEAATTPDVGTQNNDHACAPDQIRAAVDGVEACYDVCNDGQCDAGERCASGVCIQSDSDQAPTQTTPVSACDTNADCRADQHCVATPADASSNSWGTCEDVLACEKAWYDMDDTYHVWAVWEGCGDGKEYRAECDRNSGYEAWSCHCVTNGVSTGWFETTSAISYYGREDLFQDTVNARCDWLMPGPSYSY